MHLDQNNDYDIFINRIIDALRDHTDPTKSTADERKSGASLWRTTTPQDYLATLSQTYGDNLDAALRKQIHHALDDQEVDVAFFLILTLSRLPLYSLNETERRPWG
ncbi:hypothetical protein [Terasakiella sp. SH-1]|uniref:hypothetical protein n=1 Tax=Terasakiella sp. SH-1 TaxID=2560057 RepID=UPI001072F730|nr:hypothetical protein [Terasakiella sp. SH-1]